MIEVLKQALEALEINLIFLRNVKPFNGQEDLASDCVAMTEETITSLRQAIAEAEKQEPVAWCRHEDGMWVYYETKAWDDLQPLYTHPPQRTEQEPFAWVHNFIDGGISIGKRPSDLDRHPDRWTALYKEPKPCPTCEALARTVMLDQTSHDTHPPQD